MPPLGKLPTFLIFPHATRNYIYEEYEATTFYIGKKYRNR